MNIRRFLIGRCEDRDATSSEGSDHSQHRGGAVNRQAPEEAENPGYEQRDVSFGGVVKVGIAFLAGMLVVLLITFAVQSGFSGRLPDFQPHPPNLVNQPGVTPPPGPRLQPDPADELHAFRTHEDEILDSYGWVDQKAGIVRIPIREAMDLILKRGLPTRPATDANGFQDEGSQLPGNSSSGQMMQQVSP